MKYRIFIGEKPIEELTEEEREKFANDAAERLGRVLNELLTEEEFEKI